MSTTFLDARSVDTWDARFRWREAGELRDVVVEDTWRRVARALAPAEHGRAKEASRYADAFSRWRLLPDPSVLARAGTGMAIAAPGPLCVALNIAAFVQETRQGARLDLDGLRAHADMAVRLLDDSNLLAGLPVDSGHVCIIGLADALRGLGHAYCDRAGPAVARELGAAIAEGTLAANVRLASERGARAVIAAGQLATWAARGTPATLVQAAVQQGLRRTDTTRIEPQRTLALFANAVSDGLGPHPVATTGAAQQWKCSELCPGAHARFGPDAAPVHAALAELELRGALQPFVDQAIDLPLMLGFPPGQEHVAACLSFAERVGLPTPRLEAISH